MLKMDYQNDGRDAVNVTRKAYREALEALEAAYRETVAETPAKTLRSAISALSARSALTTDEAADFVFSALASVVNDEAWDGRIWPSSAEWARNHPGCLDESTAVLFRLGTNIHRAHLNQLAQAAREACMRGLGALSK